MARHKEDILKDLMESVLNMDEELALKAAQEAIEAGLDVFEAINGGLVVGMEKAGDLFETGEYFVPELLMCSDAMYIALDVLKPHLKVQDSGDKVRCVIGVVEGDTHDIGKNLVKIMLEVAGFEIHDLGRNVPISDFVGKAKEVDAALICLSTLMTTTMDGMEMVIEQLVEEGIRGRFKVMVGGGPISPAFAEKIGADGYAANASTAVKVARELCGIAA